MTAADLSLSPHSYGSVAFAKKRVVHNLTMIAKRFRVELRSKIIMISMRNRTRIKKFLIKNFNMFIIKNSYI